MSSLKNIIILAVITAITGISFIWFGIFNVAANDKHWTITTEFLEIVRNRSISSRADDISVPDLTNEARIQRGAANYDAMCAQCHLAPGVKTSELFEGLNPKPPILYKDDHISEMPATNTFWVIKNGIKMTGMPAWGINNSDDQIWDLIATISAMNKMSPAQYQKLVESGAHTHKDGEHADANQQTEDHHSNTATNEAQDHHDDAPAENDHHAAPVKKKTSDHHDDGHTH